MPTPLAFEVRGVLSARAIHYLPLTQMVSPVTSVLGHLLPGTSQAPHFGFAVYRRVFQTTSGTHTSARKTGNDGRRVKLVSKWQVNVAVALKEEEPGHVHFSPSAV